MAHNSKLNVYHQYRVATQPRIARAHLIIILIDIRNALFAVVAIKRAEAPSPAARDKTRCGALAARGV